MNANLRGEIVLRHLEKFLGNFTKRWLTEKDDSASTFQVLLFPKCPEFDCICLATYGLSAHELAIKGKGDKVVRMELLICADSTYEDSALAALLFAVGGEFIKSHSTPGVHAVLPGDGPILENSQFESFYMALPGFFPAEFEVCEQMSPPVAICQLIPVSQREAGYIGSSGWRAFEKEIAEQGADILAFDRRSEISLPDK